MAIEYEDLDEIKEEQEQEEDRGDFVDDEDDELESQDDSEDEEDLEDDDEPEDSDEEVDEEELDEEDETPNNKIKIPKSRLDEVIRQREEARERNAWLEEQLEKLINANLSKAEQQKIEEVVPTYDFETAEEQYITLILEGETAKASKLRREIDEAKSAEYKQMINSLAENLGKQAESKNETLIEEGKFNTLIENFENKFKFLDYEAEEYNEEAVDTVNTLLAGYVAAGKPKSEALRLAVNKVAPLYTKTVEKKTVSLGNQRKVEAGKRAAKAAKSQPMKTKSVSTKSIDAETTDVKRMSERDFSKLSAKEKSILRGDSF